DAAAARGARGGGASGGVGAAGGDRGRGAQHRRSGGARGARGVRAAGPGAGCAGRRPGAVRGGPAGRRAGRSAGAAPPGRFRARIAAARPAPRVSTGRAGVAMKLTHQPLPVETQFEFRIALVARQRTANTLVRIEHDGLVGLGEASPWHYYGESEAVVRAALDALA